MVQANEVEQEGGLSDAEFDKFFEDARKSITSIMEEEEKKAVPAKKQLTPAEIKALKRQEELLAHSRNFKGFKHLKDDIRDPSAGYYGGF